VAAAGGETPTAGVSPPASFAQNCTEYRSNLLQFQLGLRQFSKAVFNQCRYKIQIRRFFESNLLYMCGFALSQ